MILPLRNPAVWLVGPLPAGARGALRAVRPRRSAMAGNCFSLLLRAMLSYVGPAPETGHSRQHFLTTSMRGIGRSGTISIESKRRRPTSIARDRIRL